MFLFSKMFCQILTLLFVIIIHYWWSMPAWCQMADKRYIALMNCHFGTTEQAELLLIPSHLSSKNTEKTWQVPTSSLPAQGYLALMTVFPPSCLFSAQPAQSKTICDLQSVFCRIFGMFACYVWTLCGKALRCLLCVQDKRKLIVEHLRR